MAVTGLAAVRVYHAALAFVVELEDVGTERRASTAAYAKIPIDDGH